MNTVKYNTTSNHYCNQGLLTNILYIPLFVVLLISMPFNKLIYGNWKFQSDKHSFVNKITKGL